MSELEARPTRYPVRRLIVLGTMLVSVAVAYGQMAFELGLSPSEFASQGDTTLRAASYAFSIWGVIYGWLLIYAVYQALPRTPETHLVRGLGWPSVLAFTGITLWVAAAAADQKWASVLLIVASALMLIVPMALAPSALATAPRLQRWLVAWPLGLLAGWLTIASVLNLITVLTALGRLPQGAPPFVWAVLGIALAVLVAAGVTWRIRLWTYPVPVAWGLVGAFSAEQADGDSLLAMIALGAAFTLAIIAAIILLRKPASPALAEDLQPAVNASSEL